MNKAEGPKPEGKKADNKGKMIGKGFHDPNQKANVLFINLTTT